MKFLVTASPYISSFVFFKQLLQVFSVDVGILYRFYLINSIFHKMDDFFSEGCSAQDPAPDPRGSGWFRL